jgi:transcription termination/antitermination protein NusA
MRIWIPHFQIALLSCHQVRITDAENRRIETIVAADQLSLAIGKNGQNVQLASELVGWNINVRSEGDASLPRR